MRRSKSNENLFKHDLATCHSKILEVLRPNVTQANLEHTINMMFNQRRISRVFSVQDVVEVVSPDGETLLSAAVKVGNAQLAQQLLELGSDASHYESGDSLLISACEMLALDLVTALLAHPKTDLAAEENLAVLSRLLSMHTSDPGERSTVEKIATRLIDAGASLSQKSEITVERQLEELDPLEIAVEKGYSSVVGKIVSAYPASLFASFQENVPSDTVLHRAVRNSDLDVVKILLRSDSPVMGKMIRAVDKAGKTVLHIGAESRVSLVLPHLLEDPRAKAIVNQRDSLGQTPLHYVALNKNAEMFKLMMHEGADPNIANNEMESAFGIASAQGLMI